MGSPKFYDTGPREFFFGTGFNLDYLQTTGTKVKLGAFNPFPTALKARVLA